MNKNSFVKYFMLIFCIGKIFGDESILSSLKKREFEIDLKKSVVESQKLHDSWINPINMSYIFDKSNQLGKFSDTRIFKITIDQPIFKSGGIYFAIKYANASKKYFSLSVKEAEKELTAKALSLLYSYKKTKLLIKKQKLLIANAKIDVIRKKEQYLNGLVDSSFLDQALLNKNQAELRLIELISSLKEIYENFKNISDKNPDSLKMPIFRLIEKRDFLKNNLGILKSNEDKNVKEYFKKMTIARYLPSFSLTASYNYQHNDNNFFYYKQKNSYKEIGFRIAMPLFDINSFRNIESTKLDFLKARIVLKDAKRKEINSYTTVLKKYKLNKQKILLAQNDLKLYKNLLETTTQQYDAGEKTKYDMQTLRNSLEMKKIDIKIYEIDRNLILLNLYKRINR